MPIIFICTCGMLTFIVYTQFSMIFDGVRTTLGERCTRKEATERVGSNTSGLPDCPGCGAGEMGRFGMKLPQAMDD
ncbi:hypothetical protein NDU88_004957 [Pleurodeles waltl]|uniref:Uncharacterized protein n=1 Tax=Pleurodeles waltl TaxID=8319 RepID=A0AAV7T9L4_PLEWA|nr:hypothetical protein NDU88_004957 [Pleurodeles waltl]